MRTECVWNPKYIVLEELSISFSHSNVSLWMIDISLSCQWGVQSSEMSVHLCY